MSARIDQNDSLAVFPKLDNYMSLMIWVTTCIENHKALQIKSNTNKTFDQQKEINNLMFMEELILIVQDEIIFRNIQNFIREKLQTDIQLIEEKLAEEQYAKKIQNDNYIQQLLINQQLLQSIKNNEYVKTLNDLNAMRVKLNEQLYYLNNKINQYQSVIDKLNTRLGNNLDRIVSDYNAQNYQREFKIEDNIINVNFRDTYSNIVNDASEKYNKNESFDLKELALERIRNKLYEGLGSKLAYLGQDGLDKIERIAQDEYARFESFLQNHGNGQSFIRDLENRDKVLERLDSVLLQRNNVENLVKRIETAETRSLDTANSIKEGNVTSKKLNEVEEIYQDARDIGNEFANVTKASVQNDDDDELAALFGDDNDPQPDDQPNDNLGNQQEFVASAPPENVNLEENPEQQPAPPGGISPIVENIAGPHGGPQIPDVEEPEPEPPIANEVKSQPEAIKPKSSTLAALSKLGISKSDILEKKEADKKREEEAKKVEQPIPKAQSQDQAQRKPDEPDQSGPKIGRKF